MFEDVISLKNLFTAWEEFRPGKRSTEDVQLFEHHLEDNLFRLHWELRNGVYKHGHYERFQIFDPKHRIIHKAAVRDRVVHHAVYRMLAPIFERSFIHDSFSCQIGKGTHAAVDRLECFIRKASQNYTGPCWALKCDIRKFFNSIDRTILAKLIEAKVSNPDVLSLLHDITHSFVVVDNLIERERERASWNPYWKSHIATICECVYEPV